MVVEIRTAAEIQGSKILAWREHNNRANRKCRDMNGIRKFMEGAKRGGTARGPTATHHRGLRLRYRPLTLWFELCLN